jgi:hypothetical protein
MSSDRNLLFAVLALQADCIHREQLVDAVMAWRGRVTSLEYVFHSRANVLLTFRVREDVELVLPKSIEDGIGDLHRRHPSQHQLAEGFPPCCRCRTEWLRRRKVPRTVPR